MERSRHGLRTWSRHPSRGPASVVALAALVAALTFLPVSRASAEPVPGPVRAVMVTGHETLSRREIERILVPDSEAPFAPEALSGRVDSLLAVLAAAGRPFARADVDWAEDENGDVDLNVSIDEGPPGLVSSLAVEGAVSLDAARILGRAGLRPGAAVTRPLVLTAFDAVTAAYADRGYPFASIRLAGATLEQGGLALRVRVDEGIEARVADVVIAGNDVTRDQVIEREAGVAPGQLLNQSAIERIRPRLEKLPYLRSVSEPVVAVDPATGEATVGIEVVEARASHISGVLGYVPGSTSDEGAWNGRVDVGLENIAGSGRAASARWEQIQKGYTRIAFSYLEPWVLGAPIDIGVRGEQTVHDTLYTTTEGDALLTARMGERLRVTWSFGGESYVPGGAARATSTYRTGLGASFDGTDAPLNPTRGVALLASLEYAAKREVDGDARNRSGTAIVDGRTFIPVRVRQVIALRGRLAGIASSEADVPFHELLTLGGATDLRGYREEQFRGTRTALASLEYRFILSRFSRFLLFVDAGYYYRDGSNFAKGTKLGYGIGLRSETRLSIIGVDYGLGEGDGLLEGKLHLSLVRQF
jgi:outer membrane protein insertion porin family